MKLDIRATAVAAAMAMIIATPGSAQQTPPPHRNVISANPFGLLLELFNAEYERVLSGTSTAGFGGSMFPDDGDGDRSDRYVNADVFWRYYPSGRPLDGWAFGAKAGLTRMPDQGTHFGFGFDVNRSWLLGVNEKFYVGIGFGLKRLIGVEPDDFSLEYIPTIRLVNVGFAF